MRQYELVVLLHPDLEIDADRPISKIDKLIEAAGGKATKRDNWGKKRLAYRVKGQDFAVYAFFEIDLEPSQVQGLERNLLLTEEILRFLLVTKPEVAAATKPSKKTSKQTVAAVAEAEE